MPERPKRSERSIPRVSSHRTGATTATRARSPPRRAARESGGTCSRSPLTSRRRRWTSSGRSYPSTPAHSALERPSGPGRPLSHREGASAGFSPYISRYITAALQPTGREPQPVFLPIYHVTLQQHYSHGEGASAGFLPISHVTLQEHYKKVYKNSTPVEEFSANDRPGCSSSKLVLYFLSVPSKYCPPLPPPNNGRFVLYLRIGRDLAQWRTTF